MRFEFDRVRAGARHGRRDLGGHGTAVSAEGHAPAPQARATVADATRLLIRLSDTTLSWCLLNELAHTMSSTHEGESDGHGPRFMGLYAQLLIRYLRVPPDALGRSLHDADIEVDMHARPVFLNDQPTG
jgi:hypothetical protein